MSREIIVPGGETPKKLENFLKKRYPIGYVRKLFRKNGVRLNGKRPKAGDVARPGDRIQFYIPFDKQFDAAAARPSARAEPDIVFENEEILLCNKPAGVAVHEGKGVLKRRSLLGMIEAVYWPKGIAPKLVHRLDRETSGLLLVAKGEDVARELEALFVEGKVDKRYLCLVAGALRPDEGLIDSPLPGREGKPVRARTRYKVQKRFSEATLIRVKLDTGRMHQIRLHFAELDHPVVMDKQYGDFAFNKRFHKIYGLKRQFLHACGLGFEYHGKKRIWTAPLPDDLERTLEALDED